MNQIERETQDMQKVVGRLLQIGVGLSAAVVLIGAVVLLWRHGHEVLTYTHFKGEPENLKTVPGIVGSAFGGARNLIQLGLVLLIATPIARVAFSIYTFMKERDRVYSVFTVVVLLLLSYSLFASR